MGRHSFYSTFNLVMNKDLTARLPLFRFALSLVLALAALSNFCLCIALLDYQISKTRGGYNKPVPALLTAAGFTLLHLALFLPPVPAPPSPSLRRRLTPLLAEVLSLCVLSFFTLGGIIRLHRATPGLMDSCGGFFICVGLQGIVALSWLSWLGLSLLFTTIFGSTIYHHKRGAGMNKPLWRISFGEFDWGVYNVAKRGQPTSRGLRRTRMSVQLEGGKL